MSSISILGDTSGSVLIQAPAVAGSPTLTLPTTSGTVVTNASPNTIVQALWVQQAAGNISVTNSTGGQSSLYGQPSSRVYGDLVSISITPLSASNRLLFLCHAGMTSAGGSTNNQCAWGIVIVKNNITGYETGDYPWYSNGGNWASSTAGYPPDQHYQYTLSAGSTSSQTFYLKGWAYSEGNSITSNFRASSLIVLEVAA